MKNTERDFVLACINPPRVWNFYPTLESAAEAQPTINAKEDVQYTPMSWDEFVAGQRAFYLDGIDTPITREKYWQMLEVLPPMAWNNSGSFESFLMSEMYSGTYTQQYYRRGHGDSAQYFSRMVDAADRSTWVKA